MRTTLSIDDDVLTAVKGLAQAQHRSVGEILSALARQALRPVAPSGTVRNGVPLLALRAGAAPVTPELVNRLRDELP
ncbi:MAG: hypothetical protein M0P39_05820 [Rhodocyclaceae bacterium]|jgi:hypothetical protein|nr:hypothetical protein [Rhodocyclaceae bacterium]